MGSPLQNRNRQSVVSLYNPLIVKKVLKAHAYWLALGLLILGQACLVIPGVKPTLWIGLSLFVLAAVLLLFFVPPDRKTPPREKPVPFRVEATLFGSTMLLALLLRVFRLSEMPSGMHSDQGLTGLNALRILKEGWNPFFDAYTQAVPEPLLFTQLAGWFGVFGSSYLAFHLFFVFLALLAMPLVYYVVRHFSGPRVALASLFLLAVMRWHVIYSRNGYPTVQVPLYLFGALALYLVARKVVKKRLWAFILSGVVLGLGLYTYQAFKIAPLLLLVFVLLLRPRGIRQAALLFKPHRAMLIAFVALALPLLLHMVLSKNIGNREGDLWIFSQMKAEKSVMPLVRNITGTKLMFNYQGDLNPRHNLPGAPMLDPFTGILFVLGILQAVRHIRRRKWEAFALAGLIVMTMPALLAADSSAQSSRLFSLTPFIAILAGTALVRLYDRLQVLKPKWRRRRNKGLAVLLALITYLNFHVYFISQAKNADCWHGPHVEATRIGRMIERLGKKAVFCVTPLYSRHNTVSFLSYGNRDNVHTFEYPRHLAAPVLPEGRDLVYVLEEYKSGVVAHLKRLYPEAKEDRFLDPKGRALLTFLTIPEAAARAAQGMKAVITGQDGTGTFRELGDALPDGPYKATLDAVGWFEQSGAYVFRAKTNGEAYLRIGRDPVAWNRPVTLVRGFHRVRLALIHRPGPARAEVQMILPSGKSARFDSPMFLSTLPLATGLKGYYANKGELVSIQWDPQINFTNKKDFPFEDFPPFSIRWQGWLKVTQGGRYRFDVLTLDQAILTVAGKELPVNDGGRSPGLMLGPGSYPLTLEYRKEEGSDMALHLLWMPPGAEKWEPIPAEAFGTTD